MPIPKIDVSALYSGFDAPVVALDCGQKCAPYNPSGKPFCCDICHAVPAVYEQEWEFLQPRTDLWHVWRGDECGDRTALEVAETPPDEMIFLACLGPNQCQRPFRSLSCRQFPFFPYVTSAWAFLGLAYDWMFEDKCWVISNLAEVTPEYRDAFVRSHDDLFERWPHELDSYEQRALEMREHFAAQKRKIPLLHRDGLFYLIDPFTEQLSRVTVEQFPSFAPYK